MLTGLREVRAVSAGFFLCVAASISLPAQSRSQSDSVDARNKATRKLTWFEHVRRANLPVSFSDATGPCDARIGRFCQMNDTDDDKAPKEPKPIRVARDELLRSLDSASARSPKDDWIIGQRIRYLIEAGRDTAAVRVAASCQGTKWWCDALKGLTFHEVGDYAASDSVFHEALRAMPAKERCRWTDMSLLFDDAQRKRFGKVGCGRNEALAARLWWLADPFLALPGNDRETEHYSRHVMTRILDGTRIPLTSTWADDLRNMIIRYGWERYWSRGPGNFYDPFFEGPVTGHEATPNYHFFPATTKVDSVTDIDDSTWDFKDRSSAERYSPLVAANFGDFPAQVALFRRGDSVQVVTAYDLTADTTYGGPAVHTALVLQRDERERPLMSEGTAPRGWFSLTMNSTPRLLSLEGWNAEKKRGGRLRRSVWLPPLAAGRVGVSDILLFDASVGSADELASVLPLALGRTSIAPTKKLGLYWETYGVARQDSALPVSLTLSRMSSGLRKFVQSIGLGKQSTPMSIAWRETPAMGGIATRSVVLDLSLIPRGRYRLKLELTPKNGSPVTSSRVIEIL